MVRLLTTRYARLFEKKGMANPLRFAYDVYEAGKLREISSFVVWELCHKLGLFPKQRYLTFNNRPAVSLENERVNGAKFSDNVELAFNNTGVTITKCDHNWKLLYIDKNEEIFGCLYPDDTMLYKSSDGGESLTPLETFPESIKSIFISSQDHIFVCVKGSVYRSADRGETFEKVLDMGSSISFFRHNNAMTETPEKTLIISEYGNIWEETGWRKLAYLYFSDDGGKTWQSTDFLIQKGTNKHSHLVKYSKLFHKVYMADGDNYKKLWVTDALTTPDLLDADNWHPVNRFHIQMGGYTSVIETEEMVLFGTDYQGGTNFLVQTTDGETFTNQVVPDPYRRSPIDNMLQRGSENGSEIWANLPFSTANSKCLLMFTKDGGKSWDRLVEYSRAKHKVWLISSASGIADTLYFSIENSKTSDRVVYKVSDVA